ncbi:MAG: nucleoside triphosphate pyrophosphohydrolase [Clostridia bacterium]
MKIVYNKLVRDRIPEIIRKEGKKVEIKILNNEELYSSLRDKLSEEVKEYLESGDTKELCDILEVVYSLSSLQGISKVELEKMRNDKAIKRGGFEDKIFLISEE